MTFPSEGGLQGIRVQCRIRVSHAAEARFDANGADVLQIRGVVVDEGRKHPQVVVRFGGLRRAELTRWAAVGKHLSVEGKLEIKTWRTNDGLGHVALLVEAQNLFPLHEPGAEVDEDLSRIGVYATPGQTTVRRPRGRQSKEQRADELRRALVDA